MKTPEAFYGFLVLAISCVIAGASVSNPAQQFFYGFSATVTSLLAFICAEPKR